LGECAARTALLPFGSSRYLWCVSPHPRCDRFRNLGDLRGLLRAYRIGCAVMVANPALYLDEFTDEIVPFGLEECTAKGWAAWLARGGEAPNADGETGCWSFDPPKDGTRYSASSLEFFADVEIERLPDEDCEPRFRWSADLPEGVDFAAIRFGPGLGWGPDDIICDAGSREAIEAEIADPAWPKLEIGETALLAVAHNRNLTLVYRAGPPRLEPVQ
jgi:hypothetical protein